MSLAATSSHRDRSLGWIVLFAAAIRVGYWLTKWNHALLLNDSWYYSGQAYQLTSGRYFRELFVDQPGAEHGPLTSVLMAPFTIGSDYVRWQRLVTVLCGIALVWVLGRLGRRMMGRRAGLVAAGIAAVAPNLWMNDGLIMSESVSMLLVAFVLWGALVAADRHDFRSLALLGVAMGLGALARSELALLIPLVLVWLFVVHRRDGQSVLSVSIRRVVVTAAVAGAVMLPWIVFNLVRFENPVLLTTNDGTTWLGANCADAYTGGDAGGWSLSCVLDDPDYRPDEEPSVRSARQRSMAAAYAREHIAQVPGVVVARIGRTLDLYGLTDLVAQDVGEERPRWAAWAGIGSFWLMAVASVFGARRLSRRHRWLLVLPILVVTVTTVMFYGGHRIRSSAEPSLVLLTAFAVEGALGAYGYGVAVRRSEPSL